MSDNSAADPFISVLEDLRLGVTLDRNNLPDGDVKIAALDAALALLSQRPSLEASQARVAELEAARFSYAKEFRSDESGDPDVGRIHENIRKLKARAVSERSTAMEDAYQAALTAWEKCDNSSEVGSTILKALYDLTRRRDQSPAESVIAMLSPSGHKAAPMDTSSGHTAVLPPLGGRDACEFTYNAKVVTVEEAKVWARAALGDIRDEMNRLGIMAHAALSQDANDRYNILDHLAERLLALAGGTPVASAPLVGGALFWYRPRSDGGYEGPIHNDRIEDARKLSGAWVPLVAAAKPDQDVRGLPGAPRPSWMEGGEDAVEMARKDGMLPASEAVDAAPSVGDGEA